ncbi:MAG: hypothetical protein VX836_19795 [Pseudomonadota bacterium]|nr:hypothetical protein [Pseudomonadota bacterium]
MINKNSILGLSTSALSGLSVQAHAEFTPQVPNFITARTPSIAALSDGQALLISWYEQTSVRFRRSANGGASFGPERVALTMLTPSVDGAWFDAVYGTASVFTADGSASGIMSGSDTADRSI